MPLYLWKVSYTADGTKGLIKDGGSKRRDFVKQMIERLGGKLHAFYYALGDADVVGIAELPDQATAMALSMTVSGSGAAKLQTTPLVTPDEVDAAVKKQVGYRPPGA
jgi:uncharacterized protein with GYD domain